MLVAACGCSQKSAGKPDNAPTPRVQNVRTFRAVSGTLHPALSLPGLIAPSQTIALSNALSEPAAAVFVEEGERVRAGQLLAQLNVDDLQAQLLSALGTARADRARTAESTYNAQLAYAQAPNQVKQAQAQVVQTERTFHEAQINRNRIEQLVSQGYLGEQNLDEQQVVVANDEQAVLQADAALQVALATQRVNGTGSSGLQASTVAAARGDAAAQEATADQIRREISRARIVSPIDGIVINRNLNAGEYPSGRQIFTIESTDLMFAILTASAVQAYQIHVGGKVALRSPGLPAIRYAGSVAALLDSATPGSTNFTVKVAIANRSGSLRAGTPVQAIVDLQPVSGTIIPSSAFVDDARSRVIGVRDGRAYSRRVTEVATDGSSSIVDGIAAGETVVRDGSQALTDGEQVATVR